MRVRSLIAAAVLAIAPAAFATPITGTVSIAGNDTFNSSGITFNPSTGTIYEASGTMSSFAPVTIGTLMASYTANLTSFSFANADDTTVFKATNILGQSLSFTITDLLTDVIGSDANGPTLSISGTGLFSETGYTNTNGMFSLTSSTAGITGFQLVSTAAAPAAVTPEPSSLVLLGTGMLGVAGTLRKRFA